MKGLAIGTSTSGFAADIYVETIERTALATFVDPPSFWVRFVDDVYANPDKDVRKLFLDHLNAQDEHVQWTEEVEQDKRLAYVDTETHRKEDGSLRFTVYRKPTHTDQYLHFSSNHHISNKLSVPKTLLKRADTVTTEEQDLKKEEHHITRALLTSVISEGLRDHVTRCQVVPARQYALLPLKQQGKQEQLLIYTYQLLNWSPPVCMPYNQGFVAHQGPC